jgi:DNA polymerase
VTAADRAAALAQYLRSRTGIDGPGVYVPAGTRGELVSRLRALGAHEAAAPGKATGATASAAATGSLTVTQRDRLATTGTPQQIADLDVLADVRAVAENCVRCPLHATRKHVVFADGSPDARVMCVGEAPGANEDETGLPFVGRAGRLLDQLLLSVGFARDEVYICNVLKCRPPQNRNPQADEIERCSPFLRRQVALVEPEVIVAFGTFASQTLLGLRDSLGRMRGREHSFEGVPLVVTYHPAALLRNPHWTRPAWEDLQRVRRVLATAESGRE